MMPQRTRTHSQTCSVEGCDRSFHCRGWCSRHYQRWRRYGDPLAGGAYHPHVMIGASRPERFWARVVKSPNPYECWEWTGATNRDGYGILWNQGSSGYAPAHRIAYELLVGTIPNDAVIDHLCRNRRCVNPDHLQPVSIGTNVLRGVGVTATNARKTHCKHGHEFTPENTYVDKQGGRQCKTCSIESHRRRRAQKKEQRSK